MTDNIKTDEELREALAQLSPEVLDLEGKIGPFLDIVQGYLDVKNANYTILNTKSMHGEDNRTILIEDDRTSINISEPTPKYWECGTEFLVKTHGDINVSSVIYNPTLKLKTRLDSTDLEISVAKTVPSYSIDPKIQVVSVVSVITTKIKNILKTPSKFPDILRTRSIIPGPKLEEEYFVFCGCKNNLISCKGRWEIDTGSF